MIYNNSYILGFEDKTEILVGVFSRSTVTQHRVHTISEEETLFDISRKYFQNTSRWWEIANLNDLMDVIELVPGDTLKIPLG